MRLAPHRPAALLLAAVLLAASLLPAPALAGDCCHGAGGAAAEGAPPAEDAPRVVRSTRRYQLPQVTLLDQRGAPVRLGDALAPGSALAVNFIFTTCTTICPVQSATFAALRRQLGPGAAAVRLVSISIDPERDRPDALAAYARRYGDDPAWRLLTGDDAAVRQALAALDALPSEKTAHRPITLLRRAGEEAWTRVEGLARAEALAAELRPRTAAR